MQTLLDTLRYVAGNLPYIAALTGRHLELVAVAVALAVLLGVPLGALLVRFKALAGAVLGLATLLLTVPAIALFGLMLPLFSLIGQGLGAAPAITAAFLYSLLPIVRNTHTALTHIDAGVREAGRGIGLTFRQRLRWVELPLAVPVIFGGIRTAVVLNVGVTAIAAIVGAGGLGTLILHGISQSDVRQLLAGAATVSLLAVASDQLLLRLQRALTPKGIR